MARARQRAGPFRPAQHPGRRRPNRIIVHQPALLVRRPRSFLAPPVRAVELFVFGPPRLPTTTSEPVPPNKTSYNCQLRIHLPPPSLNTSQRNANQRYDCFRDVHVMLVALRRLNVTIS